MTLDRLTVRARRSISGLFAFGDAKDAAPGKTTELSPKQSENDTPHLKHPVSSLSGTFPDMDKVSPSKDSPSRRKQLMGSLRKKSLRSIDSLRNLRSPPSKPKQREHSRAPSLPEAPRTPSRPTKSPLVLDFEESPPGQPMLDINTKSPTSSLIVHASSPAPVPIHHSSPVPVPVKQEDPFSTPVDPSVIPAGTVPTSPAPLQKVLDMDPTQESPSPASRSAVDLSEMVDNHRAWRDSLALDAPGRLFPCDSGTGSPTKSDVSQEELELGYPLRRFNEETLDPDLVKDLERAEQNRVELDHEIADRSVAEVLGFYLELDDTVDMEKRAKKQSKGQVKRRSTWGRHTGLYDGTGYGEASSSAASHSSTSIEETTEMPEVIGDNARETPEDGMFVYATTDLASPGRGASDYSLKGSAAAADDCATPEEAADPYTTYQHMILEHLLGPDPRR
ncbi:hypothetical protein EJ02DRAFT_507587 [Clathrospora elynae]|uniref:Uncharacterized protein n=1 Tax=Clathrospora elynae TaxID=706981 RepID=A0A6A5T7T7_9PLEO|nr:hypothetical protein EJ02DRAFT_507587 [Clathrospora elynae]